MEKVPTTKMKKSAMKAVCCGKKRKKRQLEMIGGIPYCKEGYGCKPSKPKDKNLKIETTPIVLLNPNYCGKFMYNEEGAKMKVRKSSGKLKGFYYCAACDAYHVTKQEQTESRVQWFQENPKMYRNKHV